MKALLKVYCKQLVLCVIVEINHHGIGIYLEAFEEEDLLVGMV